MQRPHHLITARLRLRPIVAQDEAVVVQMMNDLAVSGWLAVVPYPYSATDFAQFLDEIAIPGETFAIDDGRGFVGVISVGEALGYWLCPYAQGLGYATEAGRAVLAVHFANGAKGIKSSYFEGNEASARVLAKLGFRQVGRARKFCRALAEERPNIQMQLGLEDYLTANPLEIVTPRLRLAPLEVERDWRDIARIGGDPAVARMTSDHTSPWPETAVRDCLAASQWRGRLGFRLGVWHQGRLIGAVGIWDDPVEVGYFLDPAIWGRGVASEAMMAFLPQMMARFGLTEVMADHCTDNPASGAVLRKLGFRKIGEGLGESRARGGAVPILIYRLDGVKVENS